MAGKAVEFCAAARKKVGARLLAKGFEVDLLPCPGRAGKMAVSAVIEDPGEIRGIIVRLAGEGTP